MKSRLSPGGWLHCVRYAHFAAGDSSLGTSVTPEPLAASEAPPAISAAASAAPHDWRTIAPAFQPPAAREASNSPRGASSSAQNSATSGCSRNIAPAAEPATTAHARRPDRPHCPSAYTASARNTISPYLPTCPA